MKNTERFKVAVIKSTYNKKSILNSIELIIKQIEYKPKKEKVFIKPNLVDSYSSKSGIITSVKVVEGLILYFQKHYPEMEIIIGEGSAVHTDFQKVIAKSGYNYLSKTYGVKIVNLDDAERIDVHWKYGILKLPNYILTHEYINIPKMKTHGQTEVSLSMKNQKGLLLKNDKKRFHNTGNLHDSIFQLSTIAIPDLNILDGIISLEGDGPTNRGRKKKTNLLMASLSMQALDNVAAKIMGFDITAIKHIPGCNNIDVIGENISEIPFRKPTAPYKDFNLYSHFNSTGCTLCGLTIEDAFYKYPLFMIKVFLSGGFFGRKDIIIGSYDSPPEGVVNAICIGSCASKLARKFNFPLINGCPPRLEEIQKHYLEFCRKK